ncbi:hypothetical protein [Corynebacterium lowii]|uniref:GHMP family kinase ATP-binding protein n=1 Tax=Corynebacterium lowii TaxID=1544413 RepID=UPI003CCB9AFC
MPDHLRHTAAQCGLDPGVIPTGGTLSVDSQIEVGLGLESSTADAVASVRAVSSKVGTVLSPPRGDRGNRCSSGRRERPCDVLYPRHSRTLRPPRGRVLRRWLRPMPPMLLVGCRCGRPVETDAPPHRHPAADRPVRPAPGGTGPRHRRRGRAGRRLGDNRQRPGENQLLNPRPTSRCRTPEA